MREKIKGFAATSVGQPAAGYPCPPFKLLILDEADSMTQVGSSFIRAGHLAWARPGSLLRAARRWQSGFGCQCRKFRYMHGKSCIQGSADAWASYRDVRGLV